MKTRSLWVAPFLAAVVVAQGGCSAAEDGSDVGVDESAAWEDAYEQNELGKVDSSGCTGVVLPDKGGFAKRIAVTFDDGPNTTTTPKVLDVLKAHGIRGTFFINGSKVSSDAARAVNARILAEGHILGNHSQNHLNLKTVSESKLDSEIKKTHDVILAAGGTPKFFRFPFGSASCGALAAIKSYGYASTGWHIDSADWCYAAGGGYCSPGTFKYVPNEYRNDMAAYVLSQVKAKNGGVLLFHDIHPHTVANLEDIISRLEQAGFTFVGLDDASAFPLLNGAAAPATPFVGDPCKSDTDCGFSSNGQNGFCYLFTPAGASAESGFCSLPCNGYCPDKGGKAPTFCTSLDNGTTGSCVSKADAANGDCAKIPGTSVQAADRFIGTSSATPSTAEACLPE